MVALSLGRGGVCRCTGGCWVAQAGGTAGAKVHSTEAGGQLGSHGRWAWPEGKRGPEQVAGLDRESSVSHVKGLYCMGV